MFKNLDEKFTSMKRKKAFMHLYYGEGMEDLNFDEAETDMRDLINDYQIMDNSEE
jgi:tubulin beta